jgi:multiple sugar transport system substrate-binding protein/putative aldouronate transport system substrate-binding protein
MHSGFVGNQIGWFGQIVEERFNMTLNHIGAPDGEIEMMFQTRSAAGNLGDLVFISDHRIADVITVGLLTDITDLVETQMPYYNRYFPGAVGRARTFGDGDRIFAIPTVVSTQLPTDPAFDGIHVTRAPYLRFDTYLAVGTPTINVLEDLLPVLAEMQAHNPQTETGRQVYGFTLFSDWDSTTMANAEWFDQMYGLSRLPGDRSISLDRANRTVEALLDDDGYYFRALRLYFNANQMGLVDPDSPTQNFDMVWGKGAEGAFLFSWYSWLGIVDFNTPERAAEGIGYSFVPIMDQRLIAPGINPNGERMLAGIGPSAQDPERIIAFLDWMSSPEGHQTIYTGPEGLTWEMVNGEPMITDFGFEAGAHTTGFLDTPVPAEWGGSNFELGAWHGSSSMLLRWRGREMNPVTGHPYDPRLWPSAARGVSQLDLNWQERFNALNQVEFLREHNMMSVSPAFDFIVPDDPSALGIIRQEIRPIIQSASWRMVFASDEAEFYRIWEETKATAYGLGWAELVEHDTAIAQDFFTAMQAALDAMR